MKTTWILSLTLLFFWNLSICQENFGPYSKSTLTPDDGLSQGSNYFRFEDSYGFMWITCNDAINRYDGKTVKVYNLDKYFNNCPNLQQGYGIVEDKKGNLYIGSVRGLYIYHRDQDRFSLQKIYPKGEEEIAMPFAVRVGKVWCYNKKYQLATYDINSKNRKQITQLKLKPLPSIHIYELVGNNFYSRFPFMDKNGKFWFIEKNNVLKFDPNTNESVFPLQKYISENSPDFLSCAYYKEDDLIYFGHSKGVLIFNNDRNNFKNLEKIGDKQLLNVNQVAVHKNMLVLRSFLIDFLVERNTLKLSKIQINLLKEEHRAAFGFDKSGRFWCCNDGLGQVIYAFRPLLINKLPNEFNGKEYFKNSGVGRIAEFPENKIIVPVSLDGNYNLLVHDFARNKISIAQAPFDFKALVYGMTTDTLRKGIWFFNENLQNNLVKYELYFITSDGHKSYNVDSEKLKKLGRIQDIVCFDKSRILCASTAGLFWFYPDSLSFEKIAISNVANAFKINVLDDNIFAVSYINKPMLLFKIEKNNSISIINKILPKVQSFYMQKDSKHNRFWVGTNEGLFLLDKNFNTIKTFNANNGLAGSYIYGLLLDDHGNAYCSHQRGLSSVNASSFQIINFDKNDGIQNWDYNNRAFHKTQNGTLVFGGVSGYNYFKPPLIPHSYYKPEVYIDEILINNVPYDVTKNSNNLKKILLDHNQRTISITALVKDLANAHNIELIYRIKEINEKWEHISNGSKINFNNLAPKSYTLELGVYNKYTNKEIHQKTLIIAITAPFYYKVWFWLLIGVFFTSLLFWIYNRSRLRKQKTNFQQKLALEQQRNNITADLHDDIGATLSSLQINSAVANQLIDKNPSEAHKVLTKIENQSKNLADKIGDIIWSMKPGKDEFMSMSSRIKNFANDILGATEIKYEINIDPNVNLEITDITIRKNIVLITKEAINNVAKYSKATHLEIQLSLVESIIGLQISDNGIGFEVNEKMGNGIQNMRKRAEELHGVFKIESSNESGTKITVTIPCP